jgi:hypothetical protein
VETWTGDVLFVGMGKQKEAEAEENDNDRCCDNAEREQSRVSGKSGRRRKIDAELAKYKPSRFGYASRILLKIAVNA